MRTRKKQGCDQIASVIATTVAVTLTAAAALAAAAYFMRQHLCRCSSGEACTESRPFRTLPMMADDELD